MITGPRLNALVVLALWGVFLAWYDGCAEPLTPMERDAFLTVLASRAGERGDAGATRRLAPFLENDDGGEFFMINLIEWRDTPEADEENATYARFMIPRLLARASHPVYIGVPIANLVEFAGAGSWDQVTVVRYRSRRDLLEIVADPEFGEAVKHKWASVERTLATPTTVFLAPLTPRPIALLLLALLGLAAHALLRGRTWYRRVV
jgi:hypothetical protein